MKDTSEQMAQKQFDIVFSKSLKERMLMSFEMIDYAALQTKRLLKKWHPHLDEQALTIAFIQFYYADVIENGKLRHLPFLELDDTQLKAT